MKKVIKVKLDPQSVADAITQLQMYREDLERRVKILVKNLTSRGAEIVRMNIFEMDAVYSKELLNSVEEYFGVVDGKHIGFIRVNAEYGALVEFGTGIVGKVNSHDLAGEKGYKYDVNNHGEAGWWWPDDNGAVHWTQGMPSRPFMYEASQALRDEFPAIVKEVFG